ncbi:MAG: relaxase/mobilization nuclease domain-containing protein [Eubacteriales bacterium]|nr:relaxase/mobilization nuclease domain-containing protein [Eubacteriales bacterium]
MRQSFKPGEITPEEAQKVGYELAMRFTKGKHAFIVSTHTDRAHIHNHIIFNSTTLDCTRKFKDFYFAGIAMARLSDMICFEHGLSIIHRKSYAERSKRTVYPEKTSNRDEICAAIDQALSQKPKDMQELVQLLQEAGYEYKDGKHPAVRGKNQKRFVRFRSLGEGYSFDELTAVVTAGKVYTPKRQRKSRSRSISQQIHKNDGMSFLIDIQEKMQGGKGGGYVKWAKGFNLKQMAKAVLFMEEQGIKSAAELHEKASSLSQRQDQLLESVKADEDLLQEIAILRTHKINYEKARKVFGEYKASGYNQDFFEEHRELLTKRRAAKQAFDEYMKVHPELKELPRIKDLSAAYSEILERKKKNYSEYKKLKRESKDWQVADTIVQKLLEDEEKQKQHEQKNKEKAR